MEIWKYRLQNYLRNHRSYYSHDETISHINWQFHQIRDISSIQVHNQNNLKSYMLLHEKEKSERLIW